ncbi:malonyl-CoA synthase [Sulfurifustis variabilis]|uniref:Malonyl-CoA synthase n=1 Tax=Sulfurifustis variabilis TaxID=1675686 RepID=A0A1B4V380_9GAMM|nr:malonyl-CoA synthase [Sulfurifustis variabilis]BAU48003.1 malonyl-CoA synthase [Sulfurifustis variabilis]
MANLYTLLTDRFSGSPDAWAVETEDGRRFSYADLDRSCARYARWLSTLGLAPGERVAVQVEKSVEVLFFYLACLRAGLVYLPLNTAYRQAELEYFLEDAEPALVVVDPAAAPPLRPIADRRGVKHFHTLAQDGTGTLPDAARGQESSFDTVARAADDLAVILYTSGTTGRPKGAMLTHGSLVANALALLEAWGWRSDDVLLHALPLYHIHGLFVACHCALLGGSHMILLPRFEPKSVIERLPRATVFMGVPTYYTRLLADPALDATRCRNMRLFVCGSAPLLPQTFDEFRARTGHTILERYGMTETGMNTSNPLGGPRVPGTVGRPLPGVEIRIVDESGKPVPEGDVGQLLVRGPNVFKGYWRRPEKTDEDFTPDGYFRTGDLARIEEHGHVAIVGRSKDLIISGGLNVYPKEVESWLDRLDGVLESAVIGVPHPDFGEAVTAVVVRKPGSEATEAGLIAALKGSIAGFKVPKSIHFVDELPRNTMGKVQKNLLRERYGSGRPASSSAS